MSAIDFVTKGEFEKLERRLRAVETQSPLESSSVSNGRVRFIGGLLRVDSGGRVEIVGVLDVDGSTVFSGDTDIVGDLDITGPTQIDGPTTINGNFWVNGYTRINGGTEINGAAAISGPVSLNNDLTLGTAGQILAGTVRINRFGSYGGQVVSTGTVLYLGAGQTVIVGAEYLSTNKIAATDIEGFTLDILGAKSFRIPHPTKPGMWLRHGSTESPVSGTEYTGRVTLDAAGEAVVELPEYFEALNKPEGRTVQLTPVGRPFLVGADGVLDGKVTVYGDPGRDVFWLVKAERFGGDFLLEEEIPPQAAGAEAEKEAS